MSYLLFATEAEAIAAEARACDNVRRAIAVIAPERLAPDGSIYGINAKTWAIEPAAQRTERWAIPEEVQSGWVMKIPEEQEISPIPLTVFLSGVGGMEIETPPYLLPAEYPSDLPA